MNPGAIMLVEDIPDDVELTLRAFRQRNLSNQIVVARDGAEAEELLLSPDSGGPVPALILLDLKLPKVTGFRCCARFATIPGRRSCRS